MTTTTTTAPVTTGLYIGGKPRTTAETLAVANPAKPGVIVGHAAAASKEDVADAVKAARAAFTAWAALTPQERAAKMTAAIEGIDALRDEDAAILSQENGKIRFEAWIDALVLELRWKLAFAHTDEVAQSKVLHPAPGIPVTTTVGYQPLGVVTIIVPFNWPVAILGASLPHALLAGNTVIVKPPPTAPLATARIIQRIAERLPPGVLNVVTGADANMVALIRDVAKVCFTGSVAGGKKIMELAAGSLTRVTLELGGNDPAILLEDAIIDDAHLDRLYAAIYATTGQICMNAKRVYVHRSRVDEVVKGLSARLAEVKLGYGLPDSRAPRRSGTARSRWPRCTTRTRPRSTARRPSGDGQARDARQRMSRDNIPSLSSGGSAGLAIGDLNGDGLADVAALGVSGLSIFLPGGGRRAMSPRAQPSRVKALAA